MKKKNLFSSQIRRAIEDCGVTRYALCQQIGVSESVLSRFMSGKSGLTLVTLDRLAEALGLDVVVTVQKLPYRPDNPPTPTKGKRMVAATEPKRPKMSRNKPFFTREEWQNMAKFFAEDAHENNFSSRRGVFPLTNVKALCIYNNNPYAAGKEFRDAELAEFRKKLKEAGIDEMAFATFGIDDPEYTYAMIIDAEEDRMEWVIETLGEIVRATYARIDQHTANRPLA